MPKTTSVERLERNTVARRELIETKMILDRLSKLLEDLVKGENNVAGTHA